MVTSRVVVILATAATAIALAACSSSGGGVGALPPHSPVAQGTGTAPSEVATATVGSPCTVLKVAEVQPLVTPTLGTPRALTQPLLKPDDLHTCMFLAADGDDVLTVSAYAGDRAAETFDQFRQSEDGATDVAGVGSKAYRGDENPDVTAVSGNVMCMVDLEDPGNARGAARLYDENGHHTDIGAPAFDVIAKNLGTLCNRIFGSGNTAVDLSGLTALHPPAPTD